MDHITLPLEIVTPSEHFKSVGQCIYCGRKSGKLGKEHIVPFGIAGNALVLPRASCRACERVTCKFEQNFLQNLIGLFRFKIGAPTRNPKDRPKKIPLIVGRKKDAGDFEPTTVHLLKSSDFPAALAMLRLHPPGIFSGEPPTDNADAVMISHRPSLERYVNQTNTYAHIGDIHPLTMVRLLAKIAHSYAVAKCGIDNFEPLLLDIIFGRTDKFSDLVGGYWDIPPPEYDELHNVKLGVTPVNGIAHIVVSIRLFSFFRTPQYLVVAGTLKDGSD